MKVLELFSGTGSVGKVCKEFGYDVVSLDLKNADINCNILDWDYTIYPPNYFDIIWASPPCDTFSSLRKSWIGRKLKAHKGALCSMELLQKDINEIGLLYYEKPKKLLIILLRIRTPLNLIYGLLKIQKQV
jgi:site-specific DNA-cytosine methylase